jgi:hypothetical protein
VADPTLAWLSKTSWRGECSRGFAFSKGDFALETHHVDTQSQYLYSNLVTIASLAVRVALSNKSRCLALCSQGFVKTSGHEYLLPHRLCFPFQPSHQLQAELNKQLPRVGRIHFQMSLKNGHIALTAVAKVLLRSSIDLGRGSTRAFFPTCCSYGYISTKALILYSCYHCP